MPKHDVLKHLSTIGAQAEIVYLEFLIDGHGDKTAECHECLAELYLDEAKKLSKAKGKRKGAWRSPSGSLLALSVAQR